MQTIRTRGTSLSRMTYPRKLLVPPGLAGIYHCMSRCVRRAFLCGVDVQSGRSYRHRKAWIEQRIRALGQCFAVDVYGYAIMSNHFHIVVHIDPKVTTQWSARDVATRWLRATSNVHGRTLSQRIKLLTTDAERITLLRERLGSLSWFMRCLKEPIARRANREDECTGRFWEGRYKTQAILDLPALLSTLIYVDLNPLRAGESNRVRAAQHTSAICRERRAQSAKLAPVVGTLGSRLLDLSEGEYLELVKYSAYFSIGHVDAKIAAELPQAAVRHGFDHGQWVKQVKATETVYRRAIGSVNALLQLARTMHQQWLVGIRFARRLALGQVIHS